MLCAVCVWLWVTPARGATFEERDGELRLEAVRWRLAIDEHTGTIRRIEDRAGQGTLLRGGTNLWVIDRLKQPPISSADSTVRHAWDAAKQELTLDFSGPAAAVKVICLAAEEGPAWRAEIRLKEGTLLGWQFPVGLEFEVAGLDEFIFPENLGLAFTRRFFEAGGAGLERHNLGPQGMTRVTGDQCQMRPVREEPVAVKPGKDAVGWLPEWYLREMASWKVNATRCPIGGKHDLSLVESEHGTWLSGYRLGGWGFLFRFGGTLDDKDLPLQTASLIATLGHCYTTPAAGGPEVTPPAELVGKAPAHWSQPPKRIGVILPRPTARPGAKIEPNPSVWMEQLQRQPWIKTGGIELTILREAPDVQAALAEPRAWFALINTAKEAFLAESSEQTATMLDAIRGYVRNGGIWWEAGGGYSFYAATVPGSQMSFRTANRDFCDFAAMRSAAGRWALFGVQTPDDIYAPVEAEISARGPAEARVGSYRHTFKIYAKPGEVCRSPWQQMVLGTPHREALAEYSRRSGFTRGLADKAKPEVVAALKRSILLKVSAKTLAGATQIAEQLPNPVLFHTTEYLRGGFDKQYPDHLPPNPASGTAEDLSALLAACQRKGHLFMPYTNPTWWCVNPQGPTFERVGDAPLSVDSTGKTYPESYGVKTIQGYAICAWHPEVRAANVVTREQFTKEYPAAVLFEDQVGARGTLWDWNPAAPSPGAYLEGIHRIAREDSKSVPLGTEDGQDRLINYETMFCGLSAPWLPNGSNHARVLYEDLWPEGSWRLEPLALFLAHDKVLFYHHDLGGFVRDRLDLSITLALGYGLSWWTHSSQPSASEADWLDRLCRLQAAIGPRCAGRALTGFEYLAPRVIRSQWGDLTIVANLSAQPWKLDAATTLAPQGVAARAPDLDAGIFSRHGGTDYVGGAHWVIREQGNRGWVEWSGGTEDLK